MRFADARGSHQEQTLFGGARVIANESLGQQLGPFQGVGLLGGGAYVRAVAFKIAVLIALGDVGALDDTLCAILHAAITSDGNFTRGSVLPRDKLPAGA